MRRLRRGEVRLIGANRGRFRLLIRQGTQRRSCAMVTAIALVLFGLLISTGAAIAQTPAGQSPTTREIRADLQDILRQPEFSAEPRKSGPLATALEQIRDSIEKAWKRITDWLEKAFRGRTGSMGTVGTAIAYTLIAALVALGVMALVRIIRTRDKTRRPEPPRPAINTAQPADEETPIPPPGEWIVAAGRHAADSDFRAAFRAVFMAILLELERTGQIEYERSRTNGDYLRLLRSLDLRAIYELLAPLVRDFDIYWYGRRPATEADYQRSLAAYHRLPTLNPGVGSSRAAPVRVKDGPRPVALSERGV